MALLLVLPWLMFGAIVASAWWMIEFDGRAGNETIGWGLLALALPALFAAVRVSAWERRWIKGRFQVQGLLHEPAGGGILGRLLDWP